jgi:hypothetical protein
MTKIIGMKKTNFISYCAVLLFVFTNTQAQNVGIGLPNPTRAKLEVNGVAGSGATSGIFGGDGTGISLQRSWPTIGFNQYRDLVTPGSQGRYMANGFAAIQYFDPTTGAMAFDMFSNGSANTFTPTANRGITILNSGNVGIRTGGSNTTSLYVAKGTNFDGAAIFGGTQHGSYFNYSNTEDTYIRAGKNSGDVIINDIPDGDILLGANNNNNIVIQGGLRLAVTNINVSAGNSFIDVGKRALIFITPTDDSNPRVLLSNGVFIGQLLIIHYPWNPLGSGGRRFHLIRYRVVSPDSNLLLSDDHTFGLADTITLFWSGIKWVEQSWVSSP